jgi:hypothetical protein
MTVTDELYARLGPGEYTTYTAHKATDIPHHLAIARMGALRRQGRIEHLRDEDCDPSLGDYLVGVYRRIDQ